MKKKIIFLFLLISILLSFSINVNAVSTNLGLKTVFSDIGRYNFNVAVGSNTYYGSSYRINGKILKILGDRYCKPYYLSQYGTGYLTTKLTVGKLTNSNNKETSTSVSSYIGGGGNSSSAVLENKGGTIEKAYLIVSCNCAAYSQYNLYQDILNQYPMTLIGPNGSSIRPTLTSFVETVEGTRTSGYVDVTDFVKKNGYGKYIGKDIPYIDASVCLNSNGIGVGPQQDKFASWKLIVIESNEKNNIRKLELKLGLIVSAGNADDTSTITISGAGIKTKRSNATGQILASAEGSDNGGILTFEGNALYDMQNCVSDDGSVVDKHSSTSFFKKWCNVNNRILPVNGEYFTTTSGTKVYSQSTTLSLYDISTSPVYLNAKITGGKEATTLTFNNQKQDTILVLNALGMDIDLEVPTYETTIKHVAADDNIGIMYGEKVKIIATAKNTVSPSFKQLGIHKGKVNIAIDSDIKLDNSTIVVKMTKQNGQVVTLDSSKYTINGNNIIVKFGNTADDVSIQAESITVEIVGTLNKLKNKYTSNVNVEGYFRDENGTNQNINLGILHKNTHSIDVNTELVNVTVNKTWDDLENKYKTRPSSITVNLLRNGTKISSQTVKDNNGKWTCTFSDLLKYDGKGKAYSYTITENAISNYDTVINGYNIKNTFKNGYIKVIKKDDFGYFVKDAVYGIYSDEELKNEVAKITTDQKGEAITDRIPLGTYYVKEIESPKTHKLNDAIYKVNTVKNSTVTVNALDIKKIPEMTIEKFVSNVNDEEIEKSDEVVKTQNNDIVTYTIRVSNVGEGAGFAKEIVEDVPEGLEFIEDNEINIEYKWKLSEDGKNLVTNYLSKEESEENLLKAFNKDEEGAEVDYRDIQVVFKINEKKVDQETREIINVAKVTKITEELGKEVKDFEEIKDDAKVYVKKLDLEIKKWIASYTLLVDGNFEVIESSQNENTTDTEKNSEKLVKIDVDYKKLKTTEVKVNYKIKVTNKGDIDVDLAEIVDYMPENTEFFIEDNITENGTQIWVQDGNKLVLSEAYIKERELSLKSGETYTVSLVLRCKLDENSGGILNNKVKISDEINGCEDVNPDDNMSEVPFILTIKTGELMIKNVTIILSLCVLLGVLIFLRKKSENLI